MWPAVVCLIYISTLCTIGIFSRAYRDNLLQQWGLVLTSLACIGMIPHVAQHPTMTWPCAFMLGGLVAFATGTFAKVVHFNRRFHAARRTQREAVGRG